MTFATAALRSSPTTQLESPDRYQRTFVGFVIGYLLLLVGEGALRKWIVPDLSGPLLIVRDPLVILIYGWALVQNRFQISRWVWYATIITVLSFTATLATTDLPVAVPIYGARIDVLHLPLVFLMATTMDRRDVETVGRVMLWISPAVTLLMAMQFNAGPGSWLNVGVGGGVDAQLTGALGRLRPSGPFPFTSGPSLFFPGVAAFVAYGWLTGRMFSRPLLLVSTVAVAVATPISISRTLVISIGFVAAATLLVVWRMRAGWWRFFVPLLLGPAVLYMIGAGDVLIEGLVTFSRRWVEAANGDVVGSTFGRFFSEFTVAFTVSAESPAFGHGLGLGSNVGAVLTTGARGFALAETEWARIIMERGALLGWLYLIMRIGVTTRLLHAAWIGRKEDNPLVVLLAASAVIPMLVGQWSPPTVLGFATLYGGLTLAALNPPADEEADYSIESPDPAPAE